MPITMKPNKLELSSWFCSESLTSVWGMRPSINYVCKNSLIFWQSRHSPFLHFFHAYHNFMFERCSAKYESYQTDCFDTSYKSTPRVWLFWRKSLSVFKSLYLAKLLFYWVALRWFCMTPITKALNTEQFFLNFGVLLLTQLQTSSMNGLNVVLSCFFVFLSSIFFDNQPNQKAQLEQCQQLGS